MYKLTDYCVCPECGSELIETKDALRCVYHKIDYEIKNGIPILLPKKRTKLQVRYLDSYNQLAKDDLVDPIEKNREIRHSALRDFIGRVQGKKILDIGSSNLLLLQQTDASFIVAFDIAVPYLEAIPSNDNIARVCGDAEFLPVDPNFFDLIIISDLLEHLLEPKRLVERLDRISNKKTRIIVHIPWEEDLSVYQDSKYEFTHLRSFNNYRFSELWSGKLIITRMKGTYPSLDQPIIFTLQGKIPNFIYNLLIVLFYRTHRSFTYRIEHRRQIWIRELPKRERWLLRFYKPKFRMFELRPLKGSFIYKILILFRGIQRQ